MTFSFLLRFQEPCEPALSSETAIRTATITKIRKEQPDAVPTTSDFRSIHGMETAVGTATNTRIRSEQGDADSFSAARAISVSTMLGTMTITAVNMEATDHDPGRHRMMVFP